MKEIDGQTIRGTIVGYEKFMRSVIWRDLLQELIVWKALAESEYKDAKSMEDVAKIQGRVEAVEYLSQMPEMLLDALKASTDNNYS